MRTVRYSRGGAESYGFVVRGEVVDRVTLGMSAPTVQALIADGEMPAADALESADRIPWSAVELLPPLAPGKILCAGVNFPTHRAETGQKPERPEYPVIFTRFADSVVADGDELRKPTFTDVFDYEGELAVVIGRRAWQVSERDALSHVFGYSCFNDGTVRDWQRHSQQWTPGKNFYRSGAFGPSLVTADEVPSLATARLQTRVNGEVRQEALIGEMLFSAAELIAYISQFTPLNPGDVIAAGTPGGVGMFMEPRGTVSDGDVVEVEIDGVGLLSNTVRDA